ncbi:MAG TPA: hypothetical protein VFH97_08300 [Gemmatimonadales bacterium]|nr:hypothetical protein [Gemmatimonadales bacterium]
MAPRKICAGTANPDQREGAAARLDWVPAGRYTLKAWHERAAAVAERTLVVGGRGAGDVRLELDARQFRPVQHLNKFGQPYRTAGRRY